MAENNRPIPPKCRIYARCVVSGEGSRRGGVGKARTASGTFVLSPPASTRRVFTVRGTAVAAALPFRWSRYACRSSPARDA